MTYKFCPGCGDELLRGLDIPFPCDRCDPEDGFKRKPVRPFLNTCQKTDDPPDFHFLDDPLIAKSVASSAIHTNDLADDDETDFVGKTLHTDRIAELREKYIQKRQVFLSCLRTYDGCDNLNPSGRANKLAIQDQLAIIADINELLGMLEAPSEDGQRWKRHWLACCDTIKDLKAKLERERIGADDRVDHCVLTINDLKAELENAKGTADILLNGRADAMRNLFDQVDNLKADLRRRTQTRDKFSLGLIRRSEQIRRLKAELEKENKHVEALNTVLRTPEFKRMRALNKENRTLAREIMRLEAKLEAKDD